MSYQTELVVGNITETILSALDQAIKEKALEEHITQFTAGSFGSLAFALNVQAVGPEPTRPPRMLEEGLMEVSKLEKDSLMPKECDKDEAREAMSPMSIASSRKKSPRFTRRSSSKLSSKMRSISFNEVRGRQTACVPIVSQHNQEDLPQVEAFRQQTQYRLRQQEQDLKWHTDRQKQTKQRLQGYANLTQRNPNLNVTYDYEGDTHAVEDEEKKKVTPYMLRTGMAYGARKMRDGYSNGEPEVTNISFDRKGGKGKEEVKNQNKALEIPMFPMKPIEGFDKKNLKLDEFKKHYGKRYERMDKIQTIDIKPGKRVDTFAEPRHLKDLNGQEPSFEKKARATQRKLALPRLHGRYKCLDRYEEH